MHDLNSSEIIQQDRRNALKLIHGLYEYPKLAADRSNVL
jgi:hypothetical protein